MNAKIHVIATAISTLFLLSCGSAPGTSKSDDAIDLQSALRELINAFSGEAHIYAENLTTGEVIDVNGDSTHLAASEAKFFLLLDYAEKVADGTLDPARRITLKEEDRVLGSGILRFENPGNEVSLSFLAYLMMSISDNMATNILLREVGGPDAIDAFLERIGIVDTAVEGEVFSGQWITTSARSLAIAAQVLARPAQFDYPDAAAELSKKIMSKHYEDNGMARFLPWSPFTEEATTMAPNARYRAIYAGIELYGKAGFTPGYRGDVAYFITDKGEYVIGMKLTNVDDSKPLNATNEGFEFAANVGKLFYDHWGKE